MTKVFGKSYEEIGEKDLNEFVTGISSRMMLFDGQFPSFLSHLIKEVVNHPNINPIDKEQLESYADMFEIKWREDVSKPLLVSPVYTGDSRKIEEKLKRENVEEMMRKANIPYIEDLKKRIMEYK